MDNRITNQAIRDLQAEYRHTHRFLRICRHCQHMQEIGWGGWGDEETSPMWRTISTPGPPVQRRVTELPPCPSCGNTEADGFSFEAAPIEEGADG